MPEFYIKYNPRIVYNDTRKFNGILEYQNYLIHTITSLSNISCQITMTQQHEIDFEQYFKQHGNIIEQMFSWYIQTSMNTLLFIFN